jgi:hypothetical protein
MSSFSLGTGFIDLTARDANFQAVLGRVEASMFRLQRRFRDFTTAAGAILLIGGGLFAAAIKSGEDFEYQMAKVSTVLTKNTLGILPDLADGVRALSVEFGQSTKDMTDALYEIISAGVPAANSLNVLRQASIAAQAGFSDVATAGDVLATVLNSYQIGADRAAEVSDKLFEAVRIGRLHFEDFHATLGRVAPLAHAAGISLEELLGAISTVTASGATPEQATTQVLNLLKAFIKPKKAAVKAANELGVAFDLEALRRRGWRGRWNNCRGCRLTQFPNCSRTFAGCRARWRWARTSKPSANKLRPLAIPPGQPGTRSTGSFRRQRSKCNASANPCWTPPARLG